LPVALVEALLNEFLITVDVQHIGFKKIILQTALYKDCIFKRRKLSKNFQETI